MKQLILVVSLLASTVLFAGDTVELNGYCPVAYVKMKKAILGDSKYSSKANGKTYYFVNADAKGMFDTEPSFYTQAIQYGSFCAFAMAEMNQKVTSDPKLFSEYGNKFYFFSSQQVKDKFDKDPKSFIAKADKNWKNFK